MLQIGENSRDRKASQPDVPPVRRWCRLPHLQRTAQALSGVCVELNGYAKVCVDADHYGAKHDSRLLDYLSGKGLHAIISEGRSVTFWPAQDKPIPERIMLDWTL